MCQVDIKTSGNTTNLKKHLERRHPKVNANNDGKSEQQASSSVCRFPNFNSIYGEKYNCY